MKRLFAFFLIVSAATAFGTVLAHFSGYLPLPTGAAGIVGGLATGIPFVTAAFLSRRLLP